MQQIQEIPISFKGSKLKPPIFLTGCGRSGTSMLQRTIASHKNIFSFRSETHLFGKQHHIPHLKDTNLPDLLNNARYTFAQEILYKEFEINEDTDSLILAVLSVMLNTIECTPEIIMQKNYSGELLEILEELKRFAVIDIKDKYNAFDLCASYLTLKAHKKRWADKSAINMFNMKKILKLYPDAKFIEIYRDPRGVFYSWTRCPFPFFRLTTPLGCIQRWLKAAHLGEKLQEQYPNQYYRVKYEALIQNPADELERICNFIEEEFDPNMLNFKTYNSSFKEYNGKEGFDNRRTDHWKAGLSISELIFIDSITKKHREQLGYPDVAPTVTLMNVFPLILYLTKLCIKVRVSPLSLLEKIKNARA
ncbi:MAG: sulfotransferase [Candidatus Melainabacteria bacterium]|nr:sulfotransferase [Candidatus Melainabacteria bacterium]MBI3308724.1 sulfotransferase [Candidatus Melainabacteria bacterium]